MKAMISQTKSIRDTTHTTVHDGSRKRNRHIQHNFFF